VIKKSEITKSIGSKKLYFKIIAILLPLFFLLIVEIFLRIFSYGTDMHLFVADKVENHGDYYMVNPHATEKYFSRFEATSGTNDLFLKRKPENGFRIFVMGSSTVYGYPYDRNLMASRILQQRLQDAYPGKTIEVINTAFTAINSITLKDFINQILDYEPDAIVIYAGHNEFYGAFGVGSNETMSKSPFLQSMHFKLMNLRIYQLMRSAIGGISNKLASKSDAADSKGTLMKRIVKDKDIVYKGEKYNIGINQFNDNLSYILKEAGKDKVPVFLSDLVSNIKDLPPFGDIAKANLSAATKYKEALNVLATGDTVKAKELFYEAKDLDPVRFRASEDINQIIYSQAKQPGVTLIPTKQWFENASKGGLIGNNLITEHLHPNIDGQFMMADAFYTKIVESKLIDADPNPFTSKTKEYYRHNWGYTALDSLVAEYKIKQLKSYWPFTSLDAKVTFRDTIKTSGNYEKNNQIYLAYKEFEALIKINPYRSGNYNKAANCLLKLNDLYAAEKYLKQSLKYNRTYFAYSMTGEIEVIKHNYDEAVIAYKSALELADKEKIETNDRVILLTKLYTCYQLNNEIKKAREIRNELTKLGFNGDIPTPSREFEYSKYIPWNIEQAYNKAQSLYDTNLDSSYYFLSLCLEINNCPLVNFYMGNILFQKQDTKVLLFYAKAYDAYKKDPDFLFRLCIANLASGDKPKASAILNELIAVDPGYSEIPQLKAYIYN